MAVTNGGCPHHFQVAHTHSDKCKSRKFTIIRGTEEPRAENEDRESTYKRDQLEVILSLQGITIPGMDKIQDKAQKI